MALSANRSETYVAQRVVELQDEEAEEKLRSAWAVTVDSCDILRTRIVYIEGHGLFQVIVKEEIKWETGDDLTEYLENDRQTPMELGMQLARYGIIKQNGKKWFVWTIHHSLYDGWSMHLILERVARAYRGLMTTRPVGFKNFIRYLRDADHEASKQFWLEQM
jgi:NRPS condensation-like uncharacterized protein